MAVGTALGVAVGIAVVGIVVGFAVGIAVGIGVSSCNEVLVIYSVGHMCSFVLVVALLIPSCALSLYLTELEFSVINSLKSRRQRSENPNAARAGV